MTSDTPAAGERHVSRVDLATGIMSCATCKQPWPCSADVASNAWLRAENRDLRTELAAARERAGELSRENLDRKIIMQQYEVWLDRLDPSWRSWVIEVVTLREAPDATRQAARTERDDAPAGQEGGA